MVKERKRKNAIRRTKKIEIKKDDDIIRETKVIKAKENDGTPRRRPEFPHFPPSSFPCGLSCSLFIDICQRHEQLLNPTRRKPLVPVDVSGPVVLTENLTGPLRTSSSKQGCRQLFLAVSCN